MTNRMRGRALTNLFLAGAFVITSSNVASAALCLPGSLTAYFALGSTGCNIDSLLFRDFGGVLPLPAGATEILSDLITVTPVSTATGAGFRFDVDVRAGAGLLRELLFGFNVLGFVNAAHLLMAPVLPGDSTITGVQDLCLGSSFTPGSLSGCPPGARRNNIVFAFDGLSDLSSTAGFPAVSLLGVVNDFAVDGQFAGFFSMTNLFNSAPETVIPEPATGLLLALGLGGVLRNRYRRRQR